tara:strand:- start:1982 stop:2149 length:168 start_codon:yes stop_codon:yes gene_type:complete
MKDALRYAVVIAALYFGVNWIADNPGKMKVLRREMNTATQKGFRAAQKFADEVSK